MNNDWIKMENKFEGKCIECKTVIKVGEECRWMSGLGIKHIECPTNILPEDDSALIVIEPDDKEKLGLK